MGKVSPFEIKNTKIKLKNVYLEGKVCLVDIQLKLRSLYLHTAISCNLAIIVQIMII